jgi:hypothetical protein
MHITRSRSIPFGLASVAVLLAGAGAATAQEACFPHCDYAHYYGPTDLTYVRPGLFGYPHHCGPQGNCAPYQTLAPSGVPAGRITVRFPRMTAARPLP